MTKYITIRNATLLLSLLLISSIVYYLNFTKSIETSREVTVAYIGSGAAIEQRNLEDRFFYVLLNKIATEEGWTLNYVDCVWKDCLELLKAGQVDLLPELTFSQERQEIYDFHSIAAIHTWSQIYTSRRNRIRTLADLTNQTVAMETGSIQEIDFQHLMSEADIPFQKISSHSMKQPLLDVKEGRAAAAVIDNVVGRIVAARFELIETPIIFNESGIYFGAPKGENTDLLQRIDFHLDEWMSEPDSFYYTQLQKFTAPASDNRVSKILLTIIFIAAGALLVLSFLSYLLRWTVKKRTTELRSSNQRLHHLISSSPSVIYTLDANSFDVLWVSDNIYRILGFTPEEVTQGGWWNKILHPEDRVNAIRLADQITRQGHINHEYRVYDASGKTRYLRDEIDCIKKGDSIELIGTWTDVTSDFEHAAQLRYLTHYDPLTGLPNRQMLYRRFSEQLASASNAPLSINLFWIDFDRFKIINDTLGNTLGDQLLVALADRIKSFTGNVDLLSRTSADEFCLINVHPYSRQELEEYTNGLLRILREPIVIADQSIVLTASIGICVFPEHGDAPEQLLINAELAMFSAKKQGGNCFCFYTPQLSKATSEKFMLENDLRHAIENGELLLHYQPKIDLHSNTVVGLEALVRWQHPQQGMVSPAFFIPLAEEIGIIQEIDRWVLTAACAQLNIWDSLGFVIPQVAVNLSACDFENQSLAEQISKALALAEFPPSRLEIEITETMLMRAPDTAVPTLNQLHGLGVSIAMDDFGTGYSNFAHLGRLPIDCLKIDQSFIKDVGRSSYNESIIRAIIALAKALKLQIVAEGIETAEQRSFLTEAGCEIGQGYLLARPLSTEKLLSALQDGTLKLASPPRTIKLAANAAK